MRWIKFTNGDYQVLGTEIMLIPVDFKTRKEYRVVQGEIDAGVYPTADAAELIAEVLFMESV